MYCPKCGSQNDDNNFKCVKCGFILHALPTVQVKKTNPAVIVVVVVAIVFVLIMILGMLAAIAIPAYIGSLNKAKNNMAMREIQNACSTATTLFIENPDRTISIEDLNEKGVGLSPDVELFIEDGKKDSLMISAKHNEGNKTYRADKDCNIQEMLTETRAR